VTRSTIEVRVAPAARPVLAARVVPMRSPRDEVESSRAALLRRLAAGDHAAMAELYDQTHQLAYGLALRIVGDRAAAEDVLLEVYAQLWRQASAFDAGRGSPTAWLMTLTRSRAIDARRRRGCGPATESLETVGEPAADAPGPEALTAAAERHRFLHAALAGLDVQLRQLIELAYFGGMSQTEIADALGQPLGTVKTRIRSAMMQLRESLAPLNAPLPVAKGDRS
jgi:RNA polymerase sigma-70 factor (ECF subfamily)